jgi:hypothetical protein
VFEQIRLFSNNGAERIPKLIAGRFGTWGAFLDDLQSLKSNLSATARQIVLIGWDQSQLCTSRQKTLV